MIWDLTSIVVVFALRSIKEGKARIKQIVKNSEIWEDVVAKRREEEKMKKVVAKQRKEEKWDKFDLQFKGIFLSIYISYHWTSVHIMMLIYEVSKV